MKKDKKQTDDELTEHLDREDDDGLTPEQKQAVESLREHKRKKKQGKL